MKLISVLFLVTVFSIPFSCGEKDFTPGNQLDNQEQQAFMWSLIRYLGRSPEGVAPESRFQPRYDTFYRDQVSLHRLEAYWEEGDRHYFLISRRAPSLYEKRVATGGYVSFGEGGAMSDYEEVFRTWKMEPDTLTRRGLLLFGKMVEGEDLSIYETRNIGNTDWIEFPDERTWYDNPSRSWKSGARPER